MDGKNIFHRLNYAIIMNLIWEKKEGINTKRKKEGKPKLERPSVSTEQLQPNSGESTINQDQTLEKVKKKEKKEIVKRKEEKKKAFFSRLFSKFYKWILT